MRLGFQVEATDTKTKARASELVLNHGVVKTPIFMPVGTQATVKSMTPKTLDEVGTQILLGNTYHLFIRPGLEVLSLHGGLHKMMGWNKPILTDSGGYQVFSLKERRKIDEEGVHFRSHLDGSKIFFTPEKVIKIQETIGSDIMMSFDECPPLPCEKSYMINSMARTTRWALRGLNARTREDQALFGIIQGGTWPDLRKQHMEELVPMGFEGYALGGLSVGEPPEVMYEVLEEVTPYMPVDKPRYLMGVGRPQDILNAISSGVDMFDCVMPTRNARNGQLFTSRGKINIKQQRYQMDRGPVDPDCDCSTCKTFSLSYLRHLYKAGEILANLLMTHHNLHYYLDLVRGARQAIMAGTFYDYHRQCEAGWAEFEEGKI